MRSSDLARMAGVTRRALRHYHKIGLLAEPPRNASGYRDYDVHHLVRLLRIRRISALGFGLDKVAALIDGPAESARGALATLDRELAAQIERLTSQRALIATIEASTGHLDLPDQLARLTDLLSEGRPSTIGQTLREQAVLMAHLVGGSEAEALVAFGRLLVSPGVLERCQDFGRRYDAITAATSDAEIADHATDFLAFLAELGAQYPGLVPAPFERRTQRLLDDHIGVRGNPGQRRLLAEIARRSAPVKSSGATPRRSSAAGS